MSVILLKRTAWHRTWWTLQASQFCVLVSARSHSPRLGHAAPPVTPRRTKTRRPAVDKVIRRDRSSIGFAGLASE